MAAEHPSWIHCGRQQPDSTAWFFRLAAPLLCGPVADLIRPVDVVYRTNGSKHTSGLSQKLRHRSRPRTIGLYLSNQNFPALLSELWSGVIWALSSPPPSLWFIDQFAFRPTGSTTAAIIAVLNTVINLLSSPNPTSSSSHWTSPRLSTLYVIHHSSTYLQSLTFLTICNWLVEFFYNHSHCTLFHDQQSSVLDITTSIIQGFAIGPAAYVVTGSQLEI